MLCYVLVQAGPVCVFFRLNKSQRSTDMFFPFMDGGVGDPIFKNKLMKKSSALLGLEFWTLDIFF